MDQAVPGSGPTHEQRGAALKTTLNLGGLSARSGAFETQLDVLGFGPTPAASALAAVGAWSILSHDYLLHRKLVGIEGFEPTTSRSRSVRTTRLSYIPVLLTKSRGLYPRDPCLPP